MCHPFCRRVKSLEPAWLLSSYNAACLEPVVISNHKTCSPLVNSTAQSRKSLSLSTVNYLFVCFYLFIRLRLPPVGQTVFRFVY